MALDSASYSCIAGRLFSVVMTTLVMKIQYFTVMLLGLLILIHHQRQQNLSTDTHAQATAALFSVVNGKLVVAKTENIIIVIKCSRRKSKIKRG